MLQNKNRGSGILKKENRQRKKSLNTSLRQEKHVTRGERNNLNYSSRNCCPEIVNGDKCSELQTSVREILFSITFQRFLRPSPTLSSTSNTFKDLRCKRSCQYLRNALWTNLHEHAPDTYGYVAVIRHCAVYSIANILFPIIFERIWK